MRLIDADALDGKLLADGLLGACVGVKSHRYKIGEIRGMLQNKELAPTLDAVPVVRCGECQYAKDHYVSTSGDKCCYCGQAAFTYGQHLDSVYMPVKREDDFCSRGEKMDGGDKSESP